jgi:molecular chaperone GrpE
MSGNKKKRSQPTEPDNMQATKEGAQVSEETKPEQEQIEMVSLPLEELETLKLDLEKMSQKSREFQEGWQRERADFMNYKKRIERDQSQMQQFIAANILMNFLAVLDDMDRAIKNKPQEVETQEWWNGVELIQRKLAAILEAEGVKRIEAEKAIFDPNFHEAISHEDSEGLESGQIIEVLQQGYQIGDRVLRPAVVRVAR